MADYAVGDLHGCLPQLEQLLAEIAFDPAVDRLWSVGDLVNRGPDSAGVLRYLHGLGDRCLVVLGNHDLHLLRHAEAPSAAPSWVRRLLDEPQAADWLQWLRGCPAVVSERLVGEDGQSSHWLMLHAGVHPDWDLHTLLRLNEDIGAAMASSQRPQLLAQAMAADLHWQPELTGVRRAAVALGYLTRLRHLRGDGSADLRHPMAGKSPVPGGDASTKGWFEVPLRLFSEAGGEHLQLVFGHWAALRGGTGMPRVHALDTGAVWGNALTVLRLQDGRYFRVPGWQGQGA